jgi:hypothetical protein
MDEDACSDFLPIFRQLAFQIFVKFVLASIFSRTNKASGLTLVFVAQPTWQPVETKVHHHRGYR